MTIQDILYFQSPQGLTLLQNAAEIQGDDLTVLTQLRKTHSPEHARLAVHLLALRKRAETKFSRAHDMVFDREGLEQSSGELIAHHRAKRYRTFDNIADLCCGIGGDAIALAHHANVITADISLNRVAITKCNATAHNIGHRISPINTDVAQWIPNCDAIFMDPGRRQNDRRLYALSEYHPPVNLSHLQSITPNIGIKVAPGLPETDIPPDCEIEFISESGTCKEAVLYFGNLKTHATRRATLLPEGHTLIQEPTHEAPVLPPSSYIAEPDNAIVRAHLIDQLAHALNAHKLAPDVAYLSANHPLKSPFVTCYRIQDILPFHLKRLQKYLSTHQIGRLDIKKRHFPLTPEALRGKLKLKGNNWRTLFLTRIDTKPTVIVCDPSPS